MTDEDIRLINAKIAQFNTAMEDFARSSSSSIAAFAASVRTLKEKN